MDILPVVSEFKKRGIIAKQLLFTRAIF